MTQFDFQIHFNTTTFPLKQLKFQWIIFCAIAFSMLKHLKHPNKPMAKNQHLAAAAASQQLPLKFSIGTEQWK